MIDQPLDSVKKAEITIPFVISLIAQLLSTLYLIFFAISVIIYFYSKSKKLQSCLGHYTLVSILQPIMTLWVFSIINEKFIYLEKAKMIATEMFILDLSIFITFIALNLIAKSKKCLLLGISILIFSWIGMPILLIFSAVYSDLYYNWCFVLILIKIGVLIISISGKNPPAQAEDSSMECVVNEPITSSDREIIVFRGDQYPFKSAEDLPPTYEQATGLSYP